MNINQLCEKLSNTSWLPHPTLTYLLNGSGHEGRLNIAWALAGRPQLIGQPFFDDSRTCAIWFLAGEVVKQSIKDIPVAEYATLLSPAEFIKLVAHHPEIFEQFMPISTWQKAFKSR